MYKFSSTSLKRLKECHWDLQRLMRELIKEMDVSILCGFRNDLNQNKAYEEGRSQLRFPDSKHNYMPSRAVDVAPYPIDWQDIPRFEEMCDRIELLAEEMGIKVRMGRYFSFKDYPHVELIDEA